MCMQKYSKKMNPPSSFFTNSSFCYFSPSADERKTNKTCSSFFRGKQI